MGFTIKKDVLYTCDKWGNTGHRVAENVSNAHYSESKELFLVVKLNGSVELRDKNGNPRGMIAENAKDAKDILIINSKTKLNTILSISKERDKYLITIKSVMRKTNFKPSAKENTEVIYI